MELNTHPGDSSSENQSQKKARNTESSTMDQDAFEEAKQDSKQDRPQENQTQDQNSDTSVRTTNIYDRLQPSTSTPFINEYKNLLSQLQDEITEENQNQAKTQVHREITTITEALEMMRCFGKFNPIYYSDICGSLLRIQVVFDAITSSGLF